MKNKVILAIVLTALLLFTGTIAILCYKIEESGKREPVEIDTSLTQAEQEAYELDKLYPTQIITYGEDIKFHEGVKERKIYELTEEELDKDRREYNAIVINDMNETVELTTEDLELIKRFVLEDYYDFIYIGTRYYDMFIELEMERYIYEEAGGIMYCGSLERYKISKGSDKDTYTINVDTPIEKEDFKYYREEEYRLGEDVVWNLWAMYEDIAWNESNNIGTLEEQDVKY